MGRRPNNDIPEHPAITRELFSLFKYDREYTAVKVTCLGCQAVRVFPLAQVRTAINRGNFTGRCDACRVRKPRQSTMFGRVRLPNGFIAIREQAIDSRDLPLFWQVIANRNGQVFEQIWVMSKLLGRPTHKYELVKHRNGRRDDNRPENLELILVGLKEQRPVLRELDRARAILDLYGPHEAALRVAQAHETPIDAPIDAPEIGATDDQPAPLA